MTFATTETNAIYAYAACASVRVLAVDSQLVSRFCLCHNVLKEAANANDEDLLLSELLRLSSQLRFCILCAPLPLCHSSLIGAATTSILLERLRTVGQSYGELREVCETYASALTDLRSSAENPLWNAVVSDLAERQEANVALLIKQARFVAPLRDLAAARPQRLEVVTEAQLRHSVTFDHLYVFGAGRWFPGFVFSAPRAPNLHIVRYGLIGDGPPEEAQFVKPIQRLTRVLFPKSVSSRVSEPSWTGADEAQPIFDLASIMRTAGEIAGNGKADLSTELVDARVLLLEQELAVFISAAEGASELTVDIREDAEKLVHRVPTVDLEPGMAVLVRTEGGGDYILAAADRIMAKEAQELRWHQRNWKQLLRAIVKKLGMAAVVERLKAAGSEIANYQNLRNWISPRSIRTLSKRDFDAIFIVINLEDDVDRYWKMMAAIDRAHRKAGNVIRRQLLQQVKSADLAPLQNEGRQDFELPGEVGGGSLTAVRIVKVSSDVVEVHPSAVHRMFDLAG